MNVKRTVTTILLWVLTLVPIGSSSAPAQKPLGAPAPAGLFLRAETRPIPQAALRDPDAAAWQSFPAQRVALNRTPPLYDTDPPAEPVISFVDVRLVHAGGKLVVHLSWPDATEDTARLTQAPDTAPETRNRKEQTAATERFFDAAAVMFPGKIPASGIFPSLQMGDAGDPVVIYYWNAARGAMLVRAEGRGTTRRTGESFPAAGSYRGGMWRVLLELPEVPAGMPLAIAVWNGSQFDRDGRKYFSVWLQVE